MPRYEYYCEECIYTIEVIKPMEQSEDDIICPDCDSFMVKLLSTGVSTPNKDYSRMIVSHSLAMNPIQIPEHNRLFPDIKVRADGCPVFDNFKIHDDYLKKMGIQKDCQRNRMRGKVIKKGQ